jgi:hypothetical protein
MSHPKSGASEHKPHAAVEIFEDRPRKGAALSVRVTMNIQSELHNWV